MKVLVISNMYPSSKDPYYGTFVKVFFDDLSKLDNTASELVAIKGRHLTIASKINAYISFYIRALTKLLLNKYDLIYVLTISHTSLPLRFAFLFRKLNLIFNIHGDDLLTTTKLAGILKNIAIPLLKKSNRIVVPTDYFKEILIQEMPYLSTEKIIVSPSGGISKMFFVPHKPIFSGCVPKIGYVSRIDAGKGWDILLNALSILKDSGVEFVAEFYGRGEEVDSFKSMVEEFGLSEMVKYYGPKSHTELPQIYSSFDVFIFPTIRKGESLGLVGLEAMAAGTPVIGSDIGGLKSYIKDNINGMMFPPGNHKKLYDRLQLFLSYDRIKRLSMCMEARKTANMYKASKVNRELFEKIGLIRN